MSDILFTIRSLKAVRTPALVRIDQRYANTVVSTWRTRTRIHHVLEHVRRMRAATTQVTYIAKNSIAATITGTNEAVDFVNTLSTAAWLCCTIIDVDLAHLSCKSG